jgi:hypothetical protein
VRWPYLNAPTAPTDERDIAAVAVRALCEDGHAGADYVLTGPQSLTQAEQVLTIGRAIGRSLRIEEMSPDEARRELLPVLGSPTVVNMLLNAWAAAVGQPAFVTSTFSELTGAPRSGVPGIDGDSQEQSELRRAVRAQTAHGESARGWTSDQHARCRSRPVRIVIGERSHRVVRPGRS